MTSTHLLRRTFQRIRPHMTPRLLIIGAQKAGTTALFSMLAKHPKAAPPKEKELDFFHDDAAYAKGMGHYRSLFPPIPAKSSGHFTFEASPSYLYQAERCAPRIAKDLPGVLCVAILRDPVKRAFSAWNMFRNFKGHPLRGALHDPRSFQQAVEDELAGRAVPGHHRYLARSCYAQQLACFQQQVPSSKLAVYSYLQLKRHPEALLASICNALDVAPMAVNAKLGNVRSHVVEYTDKLDKGLADELYRHFTPELNRLNTLLGNELELLER
ncbi:MAG: sulfotransferase [Flavobacteriales bacterium]|nr:sulfotransferase [Flavobacteriales bacterium]MBP9079291.1 sulfotransferase [Flavobacteriales bacterium]